MAKNRELSQVGSLVTVNDSSGAVGIANSVGINTTAPTGSYALDVHGTANISGTLNICLLYTSPSPRDRQKSRMPSSA